MLPPTPPHIWEWPKWPWSRLHIDYAGPVNGRMLLVVINAHTKWMDVHVTTTSTGTNTILKLRESFSTHGLPEVVVSDNGPAFSSGGFGAFLRQNGVKYMTSAPYHPSSNGLAERAVQTVKEGIKKLTGSLEMRVTRFLFKYRGTPQSPTGITPAELLMSRRIRTHLDLLRPDIRERVQRKQARKMEGREAQATRPALQCGDFVYVRNLDLDESGYRECFWKPAVQWHFKYS